MTLGLHRIPHYGLNVWEIVDRVATCTVDPLEYSYPMFRMYQFIWWFLVVSGVLFMFVLDLNLFNWFRFRFIRGFDAIQLGYWSGRRFWCVFGGSCSHWRGCGRRELIRMMHGLLMVDGDRWE